MVVGMTNDYPKSPAAVLPSRGSNRTTSRCVGDITISRFVPINEVKSIAGRRGCRADRVVTTRNIVGTNKWQLSDIANGRNNVVRFYEDSSKENQEPYSENRSLGLFYAMFLVISSLDK